MPFLASEGCFWPLTASMTSEVKKNHAHVYPYRNLKNFSEINFSIGPMVWPWIALSVHQDILGLLIRWNFFSLLNDSTLLHRLTNVLISSKPESWISKFTNFFHEVILFFLAKQLFISSFFSLFWSQTFTSYIDDRLLKKNYRFGIRFGYSSDEDIAGN